MSFDLALSKGDLRIGTDGDFAKVRQGNKLAQDVLKILHIPIGSDPFFPAKGSELTSANIGEIVNQDFMEARAEASILQSLQIIQGIQQTQARIQTVTPEETLQDIQEVSVSRDESDPRQFNIIVSVQTGAFSVIDLPFSIGTTLQSGS